MAEIFGRCSRLLNKIVLKAGDGFFGRLCAKESDKLLSEFIFLLKGEYFGVFTAQNEELKRQGAIRGGNTGGLECYVAQCKMRLVFRIEKILSLLNILKHLDLVKPPTSLLLEKNLLLLKLAVLDISEPGAQTPKEIKKQTAPRAGETVSADLPEPKSNQLQLGRLHHEVLEFIKSKDRVQNMEVFSRFGKVSRRTMKRKLSELTRARAIKRIAEDRKVFYSVLLPASSKSLDKS